MYAIKFLTCFYVAGVTSFAFAQSSQGGLDPYYKRATTSSRPVIAAVMPEPTRGIGYNTNLTFSEFPLGTNITTQYQPFGIIFGGDAPFISVDTANPTSPVLSGTPQFQGAIEGRFVDPTTGNAKPVKGFQMNSGYFNEEKSTKLTWYDVNDKLLGTVINSDLGIVTLKANSDIPNIYRWRTEIVGTESFGYAIDNVTYDRDRVGDCEDERDNIIKEYRLYKVDFNPLCENFTQTASSTYYSFSDLNTGDYSWALIRNPLVTSDIEGLTLWIDYIGKVKNINSAYRNPAHNSAIPRSANKSRHMHGDAVDLENEARTKVEYDKMYKAALCAGADYVEPLKGPCGYGCVHADWRYHLDAYAK